MSLYEFAGNENAAIAERAAMLSVALLTNAGALGTYPAAGLILPDYAPKQLMPFVVKRLSDTATEDVGRQRPLSEVEADYARIRDLLGGEPEWLKGVVLWLLPDPDPQLALGSDILHGLNQGTRGFDVTWTGGSGFLTAGHVAPAMSARIDDLAGTKVGEVVAFQDAYGTGTTPSCDAAVVEWDAGKAPAIAPPSRSTAAATATTTLTIHLSRGTPTIAVTACASFWHSTRISGTYAQVYATATCVTVGGDSGAAAEDRSRNAIGTVVAGIAGVTTLVQDVRYQISSLGGLAGLSV
jgi:hypothetical protein